MCVLRLQQYDAYDCDDRDERTNKHQSVNIGTAVHCLDSNYGLLPYTYLPLPLLCSHSYSSVE